MTEPVRAKDVTIVHLYQALCHREGCRWVSGPQATWQDASLERERHLHAHRTGAAA